MKPEAMVNTEIPFMVELYAPENVQFERLQFNSFHIEFSNGKTCQVEHVTGKQDTGCKDLGKIGNEVRSIQADLSFTPGEVKLFRGTVQTSETGILEVSCCVVVSVQSSPAHCDGQIREATLAIVQNQWTIHLANKSGDNTAPFYLEDLDDEIHPSIK